MEVASKYEVYGERTVFFARNLKPCIDLEFVVKKTQVLGMSLVSWFACKGFKQSLYCYV